MGRLELEQAEKIEKKLEAFNKVSEKQAVFGQSANVNVLVSRLRKVSSALIRDYNELENLQVSMKSPKQFIDSAIKRCAQKLQDELAKARPGYGFQFAGQEEVAGEDTSHKFICDVMNGRGNFSRSIPFFCLTVAIEENKEIINSIILNPITDELFFAEKGKGAFLMTGRGNIKLKVSQRKEGTIVGVNGSDTSNVSGKCDEVRNFGSAALSLAYVAAGKIDGCVVNDANPWDVAAGALLIKEAGGVIKPMDNNGKKDKDIVYADAVVAGNEYVIKLF